MRSASSNRVAECSTCGGRRGAPSRNSGERLALEMKEGVLNAEALLAGYCELLYKRFGTYEEVARRTKLDRRTVKKYVLMVIGEEQKGGA